MSLQPAVPVQNGQHWTRCTFYIKTPTKTITEVHWNINQTAVSDNKITDEVKKLANLRAALMPADCELIRWVTSQENTYRDSWDDQNQEFGPYLSGAKENIGNDALAVRMRASTQYRRTMYLAAIPDNVVKGGKRITEGNSLFYKALRAYFTELAGSDNGALVAAQGPVINTKWGFLPIIDNDPTVPVVKIDTISAQSFTRKFTVTTIQPHGLDVGDVARLNGVQGTSDVWPLNRLWKVSLVADPTTVEFIGFPYQVITQPVTAKGGTLQKKYKKFQLYTSYAVGEPTTRKRGDSALKPKGRAKRKRTIGY